MELQIDLVTKLSLSLRLQKILSLLPEKTELWDIGCDHGLLGLAGLITGKCQFVHMVDTSSTVIDRLQKKLQSPRYLELWEKFQEKIKFHSCSGEEVVSQATGCVVIAGMGGETLTKILDRKIVCDKLILNPFSHTGHVLEFILNKGWEFETDFISEREVNYPLFILKNFNGK